VGLSFRTAAGVRENEATRKTYWGFDPLERERLVQLYDGEVAYLDDVLRRLFAELKTRGALDRTIVVVTADHGEELGEHGLYSHAVSLYEPEIAVPLILRLPDGGSSGRIATPVGTAALGPTLLAAAGIPSPPTFRVPALPLAPGASDPADVVSQLGFGKEFAVRVHRAALVQGTRKLLVTPADAVAVYELSADPGEERPAAPTAADRQRVAAPDMAEPPRASGTPATLPPDARERLRALGYLGDQ
jgi:arylsulfatase A-like enzyme